MPRPPNPAELTISDLERMLQKRRSALQSLARERDVAQRRVDALDAKIRLLRGGSTVGNGAPGRRRRNETSLVGTLAQVLRKAGKPLNVGDIVEKVQAFGYRSTAANFRALVNQTLIKQRDLFANAGRGLYQIKK